MGARILKPCVDCEHLEFINLQFRPSGRCKKEKLSCELTKCILQKALREYCEIHTTFIDTPK
jgi:hypothetical protein